MIVRRIELIGYSCREDRNRLNHPLLTAASPPHTPDAGKSFRQFYDAIRLLLRQSCVGKWACEFRREWKYARPPAESGRLLRSMSGTERGGRLGWDYYYRSF